MTDAFTEWQADNGHAQTITYLGDEVVLEEHEIATCDGCDARWPAWTTDDERTHDPDCTDPDSGSAETVHVGHFSRLGGQWWCDTCDSPYCELA